MNIETPEDFKPRRQLPGEDFLTPMNTERAWTDGWRSRLAGGPENACSLGAMLGGWRAADAAIEKGRVKP